MPYIFFYGPKLEKEKKKALIKSFTESASKVTGLDASHYSIIFRNLEPEDVGIGGELLSDKMPKR